MKKVFGKERITGSDMLELDIKKHYETYPRFKNQKDAERYYFTFRDECLDYLKSISEKSEMFNSDYSPESLKNLELWYFYLKEKGKFQEMQIDENKLLTSINIYYGEMLVKTGIWEWEASPSIVKDTYDLSIVDIPERMMHIILSGKHRFPRADLNRRKQSLWRGYKRYASQEA